jgi:hypothetical protein
MTPAPPPVVVTRTTASNVTVALSGGRGCRAPPRRIDAAARARKQPGVRRIPGQRSRSSAGSSQSQRSPPALAATIRGRGLSAAKAMM